MVKRVLAFVMNDLSVEDVVMNVRLNENRSNNFISSRDQIEMLLTARESTMFTLFTLASPATNTPHFSISYHNWQTDR